MTGRRWTLVRVVFVLAVVAGAWWSWRDSRDQLVEALGLVAPGQVAAAFGLVVVGLALTGWVWWMVLGAFGVGGAPAQMVPQFFVAQLGKYVPGSVWAFAAQGAMGARHGTPPRVAATGTVLFLGVHVASGLLLVGLLGLVDRWSPLPTWLVLTSLVVGLVGLTPVVHRALGGRLSGRPVDWGGRRSLVGLLMMVPVWCCYGLALLVVSPDPDPAAFVPLASAFAVAFAAGVAVPIAPAGLGARDGVLVLLLTPVLGVGSAGVVAVVVRLLHTAADFLLAGLAWGALHWSGARCPSEGPGDDH